MSKEKEKEMIIDSSLSLNSTTLTDSEYKEKLIFLVEPILMERFPSEPNKQKIQSHIDRISIACPYCGDSMKKSWAKRGNIILTGKYTNTYKCFNCGIFKTIDNFIKDFKGDLKLDMIEYISQNHVEFDNYVNTKYDISLLLDKDNIEKFALSRNEIKEKLGLEEIKNHKIVNWLKNRLQYQEERFLYHPNKNYLAILNYTEPDKIIGIQKRSFEKNEIKYLTYNLEKLYKVFRPGIELPEEVNSLSLLFGIMQLNFNKPITLFEGAFDSFLFKNSVASSGLFKAFPIDIPLRYWFDDDEYGRKKSIQYLENEETVFLWNKFKLDYNLPYKAKWDLNEALIYLRNNNVNPPNFNMYFSNDSLDIMDI